MTTTTQRKAARIDPLGLAATVVVLLLVIAAVLAPWIAPYDPLSQDIPNRLQPLGADGHLLGTDEFGRDTLSRILHGARAELLVAVGATAIAMTGGVLVGLCGGYLGRWAEALTMRGTEVVLAFPPVVLALLFVTIHGASSWTLVVIMGILFAPAFARLSYGQTLSVRSAEYVEAARTFCAPTPVILLRVILPNISGPILAQFPVTLANAILLESGLSYLGLGIPAPQPSWGSMVAAGQRFMQSDPWLLIVSSAAVVVTVLCFGLMGAALRDLLDPRRRHR
ncbi:ABC transporter permease [Ruania alkalisoli]|uniref:ABC transporter permease n=1 Tax=Ruania alkalisoli TaxID=2779775 RepID=A0A7M1SSN9_9MICO|nr:ABC transporter permease [Ruania alkalisoli]QOR70588.1 ABC transporter permease [Ruania alkalisoli]